MAQQKTGNPNVPVTISFGENIKAVSAKRQTDDGNYVAGAVAPKGDAGAQSVEVGVPDSLLILKVTPA